jgi:hypothetical protein
MRRSIRPDALRRSYSVRMAEELNDRPASFELRRPPGVSCSWVSRALMYADSPIWPWSAWGPGRSDPIDGGLVRGRTCHSWPLVIPWG